MTLRTTGGRMVLARIVRGTIFGSSLLGSVLAAGEAAAAPRADYDLNNDGLIELNDLSDLNAVRNAPGGSSLYGSSAGCPSGGCFGFFLTADLNFDTNAPAGVGPEDQYFTADRGWVPIPEFYAMFDGGGHVIRNLTIIGSNGELTGLFGSVGAANIKNLRFENVNFADLGSATGALAGEAFESTINNVSVTGGSIYANNLSYVGGLIGHCVWTELRESFTSLHVRSSDVVGGLVGLGENCHMSRSFVSGRVTSARYSRHIGGLAGYMVGGSISDSLMSGIVGEGPYIGGLVGETEANTTFTNTYVSGAVVGNAEPSGAMIGIGSATFTSSFFATDTTGYSKAKTGGTTTAVPVVLADLKCTDTANDPDCKPGLFSGWQNTLNSDGQAAWDFGNNQQVPALRLKGVVYRDSDGDGLLDANDKFPSAWEASVDSDNDGAPDYWREGCNEACQAASTLVLDQFPNKVAASKDLDLDGRPDAWNAACNSTCQAASGLTLDARPNDFDNDGTTDILDQDDDGNGVADVDLDSDGLIDIHNLTELAKVGNDPTGISLRDDSIPEFGAITNNSGCLPRVVSALLDHNNAFIFRGGVLARHCRGYELLSSLDFDTNQNGAFDAADQFWRDGRGWQPIGHLGDDPLVAFQTTFEGNGYTLSNLSVLDPNNTEAGFFGGVRGATIRNLGLVGNLTSVVTASRGGILAAHVIGSTITNCYASGSVTTETSGLAGGLIADALGTVVKGCFATGSVSATGATCSAGYCNSFGGLVGDLSFDGRVTASFASTSVNTNRGATGGLVGATRIGASVSGSFSTGQVQGVADPNGGVGGLIGRADATAALASYWSTDTSGRSTSAGGGQGATVAQLQCPVGPTNTTCRSGTTLYDQWGTYLDPINRPYWNQGTATELPGLCLNGKLHRVSSAGALLPVTPCNCSQLTHQLVTNPGFETNTAGWNGSAGTTISSSTLQARSGARSLRVVNRTQGTWQGAEYPLLGSATPGETLAATAWARIAGDPSEPVQLTLRSTCQGASTVYTPVATGTATNLSWTQLSGNVTIPSCTLTEATLYVEGPRTTVELFVDDASVARTRTVCPGQQATISGMFNTTQSGSTWYCGELTISNPFSLATVDWTSIVNLNGTTVYDMWNLNRTASTGSPTITPGTAWAKIVPAAGNSTGLGFCANRAANSNLAPSSVVVSASF